MADPVGAIVIVIVVLLILALCRFVYRWVKRCARRRKREDPEGDRTPAPEARQTRGRSRTPAPEARQTRTRSRTPAPEARPTRARSRTPAPEARQTQARSRTPAPEARQTRGRSRTPASEARQTRARSTTPPPEARQTRARSITPLPQARHNRERSRTTPPQARLTPEAQQNRKRARTPPPDARQTRERARPNRQYMEVSNDMMRDTTIERFVQKMANEQPIRFTAKQLAGFTHNYSKLLGRGGFAEVYKGTLPLRNGLTVAVKVLKGGLDQKTSQDQFMAEMSTIGRTHHVNLVRLYGFCSDGATHALVYEFMEHGSLDAYLSACGASMTLAKVAEIAIGVAKGLKYLHEDCDPNILHLDIKPANVLLDSRLTPKVADFGLARLLNLADTHVTVSSPGGTFGYTAPEVCLDHEHRLTDKCDIYSFGILLLDMVRRGRLENQQWFPKVAWTCYETGKLMELVVPMAGRHGEDELRRVKRMCKLAFWCVQRQPRLRPSMNAVVNMLQDEMNIPPPPNPFKYLDGPANQRMGRAAATTRRT